MELQLKRNKFTPTSTVGRLFVDGTFECFTLEDTVRPQGQKVYGKTAISAGKYRVAISMSNRFKRLMPILIDVPNFEGVRIHPGNTAEDTDGCILVGETYDDDFIGNSRAAYEKLFTKLLAAFNRHEEIWIEINGTN